MLLSSPRSAAHPTKNTPCWALLECPTAGHLNEGVMERGVKLTVVCSVVVRFYTLLPTPSSEVPWRNSATVLQWRSSPGTAGAMGH